MRDPLGLNGRKVLIVGSGGFGSACAQAFSAVGARLCIADKNNEPLAETARLFRDAGSTLVQRVVDVRDPQACRELVRDAASVLEGLDICVFAVGVNKREPLQDVEKATWRSILETNLDAAFYLGQAAGSSMCAIGSGRIIFLSSVSSFLAHPHHGAYAASKGGLNQLVKVMAVEWARFGITVNAVAPGYAETPLTSRYLSDNHVRQSLLERIPMARFATTEDVVGPVLFLSSKLSRYVTGQILVVDGGRTLG